MIERMTQEHVQPTIIYEYPLLERVRTYLRLEHILQALQPSIPVDQYNYTRYFSALFNIVELCERSDVRTDVQKDLERRKTQLKLWAQHPDVNLQQLQQTQTRVCEALAAIQPMNRVGSSLKQHRLLSTLRQRFAMPGGTCNFDVPQLHYWLHQPQAFRDADTQRWWSELTVLAHGMSLELELMRSQAHFRHVIAKNGLIQESTDPLSLLRIRIPTSVPAYPVISGHKQRFSIRFLRYEPILGKASLDEDIEIELALCP